MTWGIPSQLFLEIHVAPYVRLVEWNLISRLDRAVPCHDNFDQHRRIFDPPRAVGTLSLVLLAIAVCAFYAFHLAGTWRWVYVVTATAALYLNCFVAVVQAFEKMPFLQAVAPTQSEPPFLMAQGIVLALFVWLGIVAVRKFHLSPIPAPPAQANFAGGAAVGACDGNKTVIAKTPVGPVFGPVGWGVR